MNFKGKGTTGKFLYLTLITLTLFFVNMFFAGDVYAAAGDIKTVKSSGGDFATLNEAITELNADSTGGWFIDIQEDQIITNAIQATKDVKLYSSNGSKIQLDKDFTGASYMYCQHSGTLTLEDITIVGCKEGLASGKTPSIIWINTTAYGAEGIINDGTVIRDNKGGCLIRDNGSLVMNGGILCGNEGNTAAVSVNKNSTFIMNDGKITDNHNIDTVNGGEGGGVVCAGSFTMNGGEISGNSANEGGGVSMNQGDSFIMNGGKISDNTATVSGGGVKAFTIGGRQTMTITGGEISNNKSGKYGGGLTTNAPVNMSGGSIINNEGEIGGGVYFVNPYPFVVSGNATVSGNTSDETPNNVYIKEGNYITSNGAFTGSIGVTYEKGEGVVVRGATNPAYQITDNDEGNFFSDSMDYTKIFEKDNNLIRLGTKEYTIKYDGNGNTGGTIPTDSNVYQLNDTVTISTDVPVKDGYTFKCWKINPEFQPGDTFAINETIAGNADENGVITLKAQWTNNNPKTSDKNNVFLFITLMLVACANFISFTHFSLKKIIK